MEAVKPVIEESWLKVLQHEFESDYFANLKAFLVEEPRFIKKRRGGTNEENRDVKPIGRLADDAVVEIKERRNEREPHGGADKLYAPKILALLEKQALHGGEEKHRPEEKLHMLPGRLVNAREGRDPKRFARPLVQKMQERAKKRHRRKAEKLP